MYKLKLKDIYHVVIEFFIAAIVPMLIFIDFKFNLGLFSLIKDDKLSETAIIIGEGFNVYTLTFIMSLNAAINVNKNIKKESEIVLGSKIMMTCEMIVLSAFITLSICKEVTECGFGLQSGTFYTHYIVMLLTLLPSLANMLHYLDFKVAKLTKNKNKKEEMEN